MIQMPFMVFSSLNVKLYGDMSNSLVYFFTRLIGYILWNKEGYTKIKSCSWLERRILYHNNGDSYNVCLSGIKSNK